jgi:hypothetical protein
MINIFSIFIIFVMACLDSFIRTIWFEAKTEEEYMNNKVSYGATIHAYSSKE